MKLANILKNLDKYLKKAEASDSVRCDRLDELLDELKSKKKKIKKSLNKEKGAAKRKALKLDLKIVEVELKKATARREEFRNKCE